MRISARGAAAIAASGATAALLAVVIVAPMAHEPASCRPGSGCPVGLADPATGADVSRPAASASATRLSPKAPRTVSSRSLATRTPIAALTAPTPTPSPTDAPTPATIPVDTTPQGRARTLLATMTEAQKIGQLFMVGNSASAVEGSTLTAITSYHVGNVMLRGRSTAGVAATARVSAALAGRVSRASTASARLFIATDEEGGAVRVLRGAGFDAIPSALVQGSWSTASLRASATRWGAQLRAAGVNLDLAPVLDTVPSAALARLNPPIGAFNREYGYSPSVVSAHGLAFLDGLSASGVDVAVKHFPGLGRVSNNTDNSAHVTDNITVRGDGYLAPFQDAVDAGAAFVMMSTAYYSRIDPLHPAAFSPTIVSGMVRGDLGFAGVIISDDLGNARQVSAWSPGSRAVQFLAAGGDMVLTVNTSLLPAMVQAVTAKAADPAFAQLIDAAALRILTAKAMRGLI